MDVLERLATEMLGGAPYADRMTDMVETLCGVAAEDFASRRPEWMEPWNSRVPHQMDKEREGWEPLAGMRLKHCAAGLFLDRFSAYRYLAAGERPICVASCQRYWAMWVWEPSALDGYHLALQERGKRK